MWDFSFAKCFAVVFATWPFLVLRALVFGGFVLIFVAMVASGVIYAQQFGEALLGVSGAPAAILGGVAGVGFAGFILAMLREYTLYLVKAGHIAIMAEMLDGRDVPGGVRQVRRGAKRVRETFFETSTLFVLDQLIKAVLSAFDQLMKKVGIFAPFLIPIFAFAQTVIRVAITYVDEMILAHILRTRPANVWQTGADTLVLYAQNAKAMLKNAFWLALFLIAVDLAFLALVFVTLPVPDVPLPGEDVTMTIRFGLALIGTIVFSLIFSEPFAVCAMLQAFDHVAKNQKPEASVERKLAEHSKEFRELRNRGIDDGPGLMQPAE